MPQDEFERLLERCNDRLAEITLTLPTLESSAPRPTVYTLDPAPPPPKPAPKPAPAAIVAPPAPVAAPAPVLPPARVETARAPAPAAVRPPQPAPAPAPVDEGEDEHEIFPPPRMPARTPPPSRPRPEPASEAPSFRVPAAVAAAGVVAAAGAFGAWLLRRPAPEVDLQVGDAEAVAVRSEKGDLLLAEGRELVDLSRAGQTLSRTPLEGAVDSMSWNQGSLWTVDGRTPSVAEHGEDGKTTVFSMNHVPGALFAKDRYLWTAEKAGGALHQFLISRSILGAMLQPIDSYQLTGLAPQAFSIDETGVIWVADGASRRLYRLKLENGAYKRLSSAPLSPFIGPAGRIRDLTLDGDGVWILAEADGGRVVLRRIAAARLDWSAS